MGSSVTVAGQAVRVAPVPVRPVLDEVAAALATNGTVDVTGDGGLQATADPDRLHQMVFSLAATVLRADAFRAAGGFHPRLWLGGEEELLAADLAGAGWWLTYADELTVHHQPSVVRDSTLRRAHGIRNTLWFTWLRRPAGRALRRTAHLARTVPRDTVSLRAFAEAAAALPWVLRERKVLPAEVESRLRLLEESQRRSAARRYTG